MSKVSKAGIETAADGASYIPSSKRPDGSTRKEIRVRPGYRPPEDVETYKNSRAEAWKTRGQGGVPGADPVATETEEGSTKSKNAKRREAARKKATEGSTTEDDITSSMQNTAISERETQREDSQDLSAAAVNDPAAPSQAEVEQQKKIRNQLKKLKAVRELREKRAAGEKLSPDQIMKIGKEMELLRDLKKLGYEGPELQAHASESPNGSSLPP